MNLSGKQSGDLNVEKLRLYLEAMKARNEALPIFNGKLNKSRIAKEAGFDRQVFDDNPTAHDLLAQYGDAERQPRLPVVATDAQALEKIQRLEAEVSRFRDLAAKRSVELEKRRKEATEKDTKLRLFEVMMETMRNPPVPPTREGAG
jgi:hypothetical protein